MKASEYIRRIDKVISELESDKALKIAVLDVNRTRVTRIFEKGLNSSQSKIGSYNATKPVYINPNDAPRKGNQVGKSGRKIKSLYYPSYKDFRKGMGRESSFINLRLNNELQNDLANAKISKGSNAIAKPTPLKINNNLYRVGLNIHINQKKIEGLEKRFGSILKHTTDEIDQFNKVVEFEMNKIIKRL